MRGRGYFTHDSILQNLDELKTYSGILLLQEVVDDIARAARKEKASQKKHIHINFVKNFNYLLKQHYSELEGTLTLLNANEKELLEMRSRVDEASKRIADASRILAVLNQKIGGI